MSPVSHSVPSPPAAYILQSLAVAAVAPTVPRISPSARRAGVVVSAIPMLFLAMDATMKVLQVAPALEGTAQLGYPTEVVMPLGLLQMALLIVSIVPRTAMLGAILWTGYLGGAVATHVRVGNPLFTHMLFPVLLGGLLWLGLWLRDARVRALLPTADSRR